jgi:deoxyadenosine/deoxycytidine kinase
MRIGFCGSMSVGKTTLVNALKELPEFKDYISRTERSKYLMELGIPLNTDSTIKGQIVFLAERASELMNENILTDRTVIDVMAFTHAAQSINFNEKDSFDDLAVRLLSEYDHLFYVSPEGVAIEDNSVRETNSEYRDLIDFTIRHIIKTYSHKINNITEISGTTEERIAKVKSVLFP